MELRNRLYELHREVGILLQEIPPAAKMMAPQLVKRAEKVRNEVSEILKLAEQKAV